MKRALTSSSDPGYRVLVRVDEDAAQFDSHSISADSIAVTEDARSSVCASMAMTNVMTRSTPTSARLPGG